MSAPRGGTPSPGWMDRLAHDLRRALSPGQIAVSLLRNDRLDPSKRDGLLDMIDRQNQRLAAMIDEISDCVCAETVSSSCAARKPTLPCCWTGSARPRPARRRTSSSRRAPMDAPAGGRRASAPAAAHAGRGATGAQRYPARADRYRPCDASAGASAAPHRLYWRCCRAGRGTAGCFLPDPLDDGLGLGLLVARAIAEAHHGSLRVRAIDADTIELVLELPLAGTSATSVSID